MQDLGYELPRNPILRRWVNKDHQARLRFLVNDERSPKQYAAALTPRSPSRYCGPCFVNSLQAATSSRG